MMVERTFAYPTTQYPVPVEYGRIDAMQLVMQRALWLAEGGWHDRSMNSDGMMYPVFARKYRVLAVPAVLGEHW
jgi:hypothetical protein